MSHPVARLCDSKGQLVPVRVISFPTGDYLNVSPALRGAETHVFHRINPKRQGATDT
jgi:hypothetical protein